MNMISDLYDLNEDVVPVWGSSDGVEAPHPEPGQEYLVEIWQNVDGKKIAWHAVMFWDHKYGWVAEECGKFVNLSPVQAAARWCDISQIGKGWVRNRRPGRGE